MQSEELEIKCRQIFKTFKLIPKKIIEGKDITSFMKSNDIKKRTMGIIEGWYESKFESDSDAYPVCWKKLGDYVEDENDENKYLNLCLGKQIIKIVSNKSPDFVAWGLMKKRGHFYEKWREKNLENLEVNREIIQN